MQKSKASRCLRQAFSTWSALNSAPPCLSAPKNAKGLDAARFGNLYLPVLLTAGIFDMVHLELKMGKLKEGHHRLMVLIENVILVLGPGRKEAVHGPFRLRNVARRGPRSGTSRM